MFFRITYHSNFCRQTKRRESQAKTWFDNNISATLISVSIARRRIGACPWSGLFSFAASLTAAAPFTPFWPTAVESNWTLIATHGAGFLKPWLITIRKVCAIPKSIPTASLYGLCRGQEHQQRKQRIPQQHHILAWAQELALHGLFKND